MCLSQTLISTLACSLKLFRCCRRFMRSCCDLKNYILSGSSYVRELFRSVVALVKGGNAMPKIAFGMAMATLHPWPRNVSALLKSPKTFLHPRRQLSVAMSATKIYQNVRAAIRSQTFTGFGYEHKAWHREGRANDTEHCAAAVYLYRMAIALAFARYVGNVYMILQRAIRIENVVCCRS